MSGDSLKEVRPREARQGGVNGDDNRVERMELAARLLAAFSKPTLSAVGVLEEVGDAGGVVVPDEPSSLIRHGKNSQ